MARAGQGRVPSVQPAGGAGAGGAAAGEPVAPGGAGQARPGFTLHRRPLLTHGAEQGASSPSHQHPNTILLLRVKN